MSPGCWHAAALLLLVSIADPLFAQGETVRFASFNVSLHFSKRDELAAKLGGGEWLPAQKVAAIIQKTAPDVLLLNEFDGDDCGRGLAVFLQQYLAVSQYGQAPIQYPHHYQDAFNTGVLAAVDFNNDNKISQPQDAYGFGMYPGQYGMVVLSKLPIDVERIRTFQNFLWRDMPGAWWPTDPDTGKDYYSEAAKAVFRLSSKSHWDIPILTGDSGIVHFLVSHPTPPVFDGPEDRNGRRNHDEIRFWSDYINNEKYIYDDQGQHGGLPDALFVIAGDLNADPNDGASSHHASRQLTEHPRINNNATPSSKGAHRQAALQGGVNLKQLGKAAEDTGDFSDAYAGNLRIDYVLPSHQFSIVASGVFWPLASKPEAKWLDASDHHLVWIDLKL